MTGKLNRARRSVFLGASAIAGFFTQRSALAAGEGHVLATVDSVAELQRIDKARHTKVLVTGYYEAGDGGGGLYYLDDADTTSPNNGGTNLAAMRGGRWKRRPGGLISPRHFGAKGDGVADDTDALNRWAAFLTVENVGNQHIGHGAAGTYKVTGAGWRVNIRHCLPPLITDGPEQFCVKGSVPVLMTIVAIGGSGMIPTVAWSGIKLDGVENTRNNEGVRVCGAGFFTGSGWHFSNLGIGIRYYNLAAGSFTEGVVFEDALFDKTVTTWVRYSKGAGDGSFRSSGLRNFKGNFGPAAGPAILIDDGCVPYFAPLSGIIWNYHANGIFIRNNSTQAPFVGTIDTETQGASGNRLTLADERGRGYTFLIGSLGAWNYGSANLRLGKLIVTSSYFNSNDGHGQMFQPNTMCGNIVSDHAGQRFKIPMLPGVSRHVLQWSALLTVGVTTSDGYYWQGMFTVLPGLSDDVVTSSALPGGGLVNDPDRYGPMTSAQGTDHAVWFDNPRLPAGARLSYSIKYLNGLIPQ
jgi:hypothetical protein